MIDRRVERTALALLPLVALVAVVPFGWDRFGPIRWLGLPALGFALVAATATLDGRADEVGQTAAASRTPRIDRGNRLVMWGWAVLLGWGALAAALGADPLHAWIGTPDRRFGWLTWLLCGGLFLVGRRLDPAAVSLTMRSIAVGAIGLGLYTVAQWIGILDDGGFDGGRLGGPLGQPAYLGAAAAMAGPVAAGVAADRSSPTRWRLIGGFGSVVALAALLLSQSRASWLGAIIAVAAIGLVRVLAGRLPARTVIATVVAPVLLVLAVPTLRSRILDAGGAGGVIDGRLAEWRVGWRALSASPLVGHGPEGYRTVFGANVDEAYVIDWGRDVITDRAHNGLLDTGLAFGLPGLLAGALVLGVVVAGALRVGARGSAPMVGASVGVAAYAIGQQFLFPLSELDPLFWLVAGIVMSAISDQPTDEPTDELTGPAERRPGRPAPSGLAAAGRGVAIGLALITAAAGLADLAADADIAAAVSDDLMDTGNIDDDDDRSDPVPDPNPELALGLRPDSIRYRFLASRMAGQRDDLDLALVRVDQGLDLSPTDPALRGERSAILLERARVIEVEPDRSLAIDLAVEELEALVADDPLHPRHRQRLGIALALDGRLDEARANLERAVELAPVDQEAAANLDVVIALLSNRPSD